MLFFSSAGAQTRVTLSGKQLTIAEALRKIEAQTGYHAWAEDGVLEKAQKVDIAVNNLPLEQVLQAIFSGQPLTYKVIGQTIVVKLREDSPNFRHIQGLVLSDGQPVESASVLLKGSNKGVITGAKGEFSLTVNPGDSILIVSCVGYQTREIIPNDEIVLKIELSRADQQLDEPVVIGYGTTSKRTNPGSVGTLNSRQISIQPVSNPLLGLQGRIPGLFIQQTTGVTDGNVNVLIGGKNSISNGNEPFYIVDGVPFPTTILVQAGADILLASNPLSYLNPQDIESISVLKDADATSIYGSRGANGVILITTKRGRPGKTRVTVSSAVGIGHVASKMKLLSTPEYLAMRHEAFKNDQAEPDPTVDHDLLSWDTTRDVDWQKALIGGTAHIFQQRLSVSGGSKLTTYHLAGEYSKETTVFPGDFYSRKGYLHAHLHRSTANRKLAVNFSFVGTIDKKVLPSKDPTFTALTLPPNAPPGFHPDGSYNWSPGYNNPYAALGQLYNANGNNIIANANLMYSPLQGFKVKVSFGTTATSLKEITPIPVTTLDPAFGITTSSSNFAQKQIKSWIAEPQLEYALHLGSGRITLLTGVTFQDIRSNSNFLAATGYTDPSRLQTMNGATSITELNKSFSQYRYIGVYGRARYDLRIRYIAEVTGRRDGSSRFGPDRQFATFGAFGIAWLISEEPWFKKQPLKTINFAKLRMSYGIMGNDQIEDYQFLPAWSSVTYPYDNRLGLTPTRLYNSGYSWESNRKLNIGLEAAFLKNRAQVAISYYISRSSNQLVAYPISFVTGFPSVQGNLGAVVVNKVVEIELNNINVKLSDLQWTTGLNLTIPNNILKDFPKLQGSRYRNRYVVGESVGVLKAFQFTGVDQNTGVYTFEDLDKDGQLTSPDDLTTYKSIAQHFYGGMLNTISFKKLNIDLFIQFVKQTGYNYLASNSFIPVPGMGGNQPKFVLARWQEPGMQTGVQQYTQSSGSAAYVAYNNLIQSDAVVSDASFIRLKNLSLAYVVADGLTKRTGLKQVKLFVQAQNIFTISRYKGIDPENQNITSSIPPLRIFMLGVEMSL